MSKRAILLVLLFVVIVGFVVVLRQMTNGGPEPETTAEATPATSVTPRERTDRQTTIRSVPTATAETRVRALPTRSPTDAETTTGVAPATASTEIPEVTATPTSTNKSVADLVAQFRQETDQTRRMDLLDELSQMEDPAALAQMLAMLEVEKDPDVWAALMDAVMANPLAEDSMPQILTVMSQMYAASAGDEFRRQSLLQNAWQFPNEQGVNFLRGALKDPSITPGERVSAMESLLRIDTQDDQIITEQERQAWTDGLRNEAQSNSDAALRSQAIMALAEDPQRNSEFLRQLLESEKDPNIQLLLRKIIQQPQQPQSGAEQANTGSAAEARPENQ